MLIGDGRFEFRGLCFTALVVILDSEKSNFINLKIWGHEHAILIGGGDNL
jgi:hypothetical protein